VAAVEIDRNLLFGVIALQDDLIDERQFTDACVLWALRLERRLADVLLERRLITDDDRREIERKVERKIKKHGNAKASLAAAAGADVRDLIRSVDHPEIHNSISSLPPAIGHLLIETVIPPHEPESPRYTLTRMHAEGGLGRVWLARDRDLNRGVALKEIRPHHASNGELWRRFLKEAQITGQLEHPNIVPVYELARRKEDDQPFYTMRFVRGQSLLGAIREFHRGRAGRAPDALALHSLLGAFLKVCDAIAYAHSRGVVHRDLKPENIVLGGYGEVVVLDWGLAKLVDAPEETSEQETELDERIAVSPEAQGDKTHGVVGTPCYMAPEQVAGKHDHINSRTDIYALGGILFEILTGRPPADGPTTADVLEQIRTGRIPRARQAEPTVPRPLEAICARAMAFDRAKRYARAADLAAEVRRWIADEPVTAYREPLAARARRWMRKHRTLVTSAAAVVSLGLIGSAGFAAVVAGKNRELARQTQRAQDREQMAIDAVRRFGDVIVEEPLLKSNPALGALRKKLMQEPVEFFRKLRDELTAGSGSGPKAVHKLACANMDLGHTTAEIGSVLDAIQCYSVAIGLLDQLVCDSPSVTEFQSDLARGHHNIAILLGQTGDPDRALKSHSKALLIRERLARENPDVSGFQRDLAASHNGVGAIQVKTGCPDQALESIIRALAIRERLARENPGVAWSLSDLATSYANIGAIQSTTGHPDEALGSCRKALAILERLAPENPSITEFQSSMARIHDQIGSIQGSTDHLNQALESYEKALAIRERLAGENPSITDFRSSLAACHLQIAVVQSKQAHLNRALESYGKALTVQEGLARDYPSVTDFQRNLALSHYNLGKLQGETGHPDQALKSYVKAVLIRERLARESPSVTEFQCDVARSYYNIGWLEREAGHLDRALEAYGKALAIRKRLAREHPDMPDYAAELGATLNNIARFDLEAKRFEQARDRLREAISWQRRALTSDPNRLESRLCLRNHFTNLKSAAKALGKDDEAQAAQRQIEALDASDPQLIALDKRLAAVIAGEPPKDNPERLQLAGRAYEKKLFADSARLYAEVLDADPKLAEDRQNQHRYDAACAAALAAAEKASPRTGGADKLLTEPDRAKLRKLARAWLGAELTAWSKLVESANASQRKTIAGILTHWQEDSDLAGVRDEAALAGLAEDERAAWKSLWADVDALLQKARKP
jgi:serine/threonine-protein kinase